MKNKKVRLQLIVELIKNNCIGSQEELARLLAARGYVVTQATLSRDLKQLRTTKVATDMGNYMYIIPDSNDLQDTMLSQGMSAAPAGQHAGFVSIQFSGHFAGADTVFAVLREDVTHEDAMELFSRFLPLP